MATTKKAVSEATATPEKVSKTASEPKFTLEALQKHCLKLFGVSTATFAGATTGLKAKEYTVKEIENTIKEWCKQEVK